MSENHVDYQYFKLLSDCLHGIEKTDRTGTGTFSQFGRQLRFDLSKGFPILTTKKIHWKSVVGELLWFLSGSTNAHYLKQKYGVSIWDEWADKDGHLGPVYGHQWRHWGEFIRDYQARPDIGGPYERYPGVDQITELVKGLKENPDSRRHIVSAWNVTDLPRMALPPCHCFFQCYVTPAHHVEATPGYHAAFDRPAKLSLQMYQRSADVFLGVPFNIASYALLTHMLAHVCDYDVGEYIHTFGDVHLYKNHTKQAVTQLGRDPKPLPTLRLNPEKTDIFNFTFEDCILEGYDPDPAIPAPVAV